MRPSAMRPARAAVIASCFALAACATGMPPPAAEHAFDLASPVREVAAVAAPALPARSLRAYTLSIRTIGAGPAAGVDVLGRQASLPGGPLVTVTASQGAGVFRMTRSLGLCGLVSLRLDTARTAHAHLPGDPARPDDVRFTDEARLDVDIRMRATSLQVDGTPCAPRPAEAFAVALRIRSDVLGPGAAGPDAVSGRGGAAQARYECLAASATEPASTLHPDLPGEMLRVECQRSVVPGRVAGHLSYAWLASSGVYLLTGQRGRDIAQEYVYTSVVLDP